MKVRLTESEFKRVIRNSVRRILREARGEAPIVGYNIASFGNERSDRHISDKLYRGLKNKNISPDEAIEAIMDRLYINPDNVSLGYHKKLPKSRILGYSRDERFFLTYNEDSHRFDSWATDEK